MKLLRVLVILVVLLAIGARLAGVELGSSLLWIAGAAELGLAGIVLAGVLRLWRRRSRGERTNRSTDRWEALRSVLRETLPATVAEAVVAELRIFVAAAASLTLRPRPQPCTTEGERFSVMERSTHPATVVVLVVLLAIEAPTAHLLLGALMDEGPLRSLLRGGLLLSSVYLAIWLIGDLRLLRTTPGVVLTTDDLVVDVGLRMRGRVPLHHVVAAERIGPETEPSGEALPTIRVTPQPAPNCLLTLDAEVALRGLLGLEARGRRVALYVDEPERLLRALHQLGPRQGAPHTAHDDEPRAASTPAQRLR